MNGVFFISLFLFSISSLAQNNIDREFLLDSLKNIALENNYIYKRIVRNYYSEQNEYQFSDYYRSGAIQMKAKSTSRDGYELKGIAISYYESGQEQEQVYYQSGVKLGSYISWHPNGQQKIQGEYLKNNDNERQTGDLKINQFWDDKGLQRVIDGIGYFKGNESETVYAEGKIKKGLRDSIWSGKDTKLKFNFVEEYQNGTLILGKSIDSTGKSYTYKKIEISPEFPGGLNSFYKYIGRNFIIPMDLENVSGKVYYGFVINSDGNTENVKVLRSLHAKLDLVGKNLIENSPLWRPALQRGVPCNVQYFLPISIGGSR